MTKIITVSTNDFIPNTETGGYVATFTADTLGFDGSRFFSITKFLKNTSGVFENVIVSYEINTSGDLMIYSDVILAGRLVINTDS